MKTTQFAILVAIFLSGSISRTAGGADRVELMEQYSQEVLVLDSLSSALERAEARGKVLSTRISGDLVASLVGYCGLRGIIMSAHRPELSVGRKLASRFGLVLFGVFLFVSVTDGLTNGAELVLSNWAERDRLLQKIEHRKNEIRLISLQLDKTDLSR